MKSRHWFHLRAVLLFNTGRPTFVLPERVIGPPVPQVARLVVVSTGVIEAVRNLVTYYGANGAVVQTVRSAGVKVGHLQEAGGNG